MQNLFFFRSARALKYFFQKNTSPPTIPPPPTDKKMVVAFNETAKWGGGQFLSEQSPGLALHNIYHFILLKGGGRG
jgi:hypothetical protein